LLLAAGYFRARISTLSPFDRVIGGLAWCIVNSAVDVDVDVIFIENATIGQKMFSFFFFFFFIPFLFFFFSFSFFFTQYSFFFFQKKVLYLKRSSKHYQK